MTVSLEQQPLSPPGCCSSESPVVTDGTPGPLDLLAGRGRGSQYGALPRLFPHERTPLECLDTNRRPPARTTHTTEGTT